MALLIPFIMANSLYGQSLLNRLRVPIYLTSSFTLGHDSNYLRLSEQDKASVITKPTILGDSNSFDSEMIRPELKFSYGPAFSTKHETNFIVNLASVI
ncbi:uncharacterized protein METZ01_LOCUS457893, partial [marine metagenome]